MESPQSENAVPGGERVLLTGEREYEGAIERVIAAARHWLHIFDRDLAKGGYGGALRSEALGAFLRRKSGNRLLIVLHETDRLAAYQPRLMGLLRNHSHAMAIHRTIEQARSASDAFVIADGLHYVHRLHRDSTRSVFALNDEPGCRPLEERFQALLEASYPAVFATTLGL